MVRYTTLVIPREEISMSELADKVKILFKGDLEVIQIATPPEYPQDQAQRRCPDITKAKEHLDYDPKVTIDKGLELMLSWCRKTILDESRFERIKLDSLSSLEPISVTTQVTSGRGR